MQNKLERSETRCCSDLSSLLLERLLLHTALCSSTHSSKVLLRLLLQKRRYRSNLNKAVLLRLLQPIAVSSRIPRNTHCVLAYSDLCKWKKTRRPSQFGKLLQLGHVRTEQENGLCTVGNLQRRLKRLKVIQFNNSQYWNVCERLVECQKCGAMPWSGKRTASRSEQALPLTNCCWKGSYSLHFLFDISPSLQELITGSWKRNRQFTPNTRM